MINCKEAIRGIGFIGCVVFSWWAMVQIGLVIWDWIDPTL